MDYNLILLILATFLAGFIDAIVGGGGLITVPTLLTLGLPAENIIASNKLIGVSTAITGSYKYLKSNIIRWETIRKFIILSLIGSVFGSYINSLLSPSFLRIFIFCAILILFLYLTFKRKIEYVDHPIPRLSFVLLPLFIFIIGFYDGFFGPGTGTFLIMIFLYFSRFTLLQSAAHGRILNLTSNIGAILFFSTTGLINFWFVFPGMIAASIGGYIGASYSVKYGTKGIRPIMYICVTVLLIKMARDLFL
ncbi:MAG: TSUP family transporter [Bdellovibrionales bacterium]|nr:TSUP family transporter [Bdellovibrionales bacterium]